MKQVLVITYYWPPSGGAGVQRWLKLCKYLPQFGWQPVVYTAENADYPVLDPSLEADVPASLTVLRHPIWEPYRWYRQLIGKPADEPVFSGFLSETRRPAAAQRLSLWLRANVFIPDARCAWIRPSVRFLRSWLQQHPVQAVVTTGPPHSVHLIGLRLMQYHPLPWMADFRDPWTRIDYFKDLPFLPWTRALHRRLERAVLQRANRVTAIGWTLAQELQTLGAKQTAVVTNGFDEEDFNTSITPDQNFSLVHTGSINADRNHPALWQALGDLVKENAMFRSQLVIRLLGPVDLTVGQQLEQNGLTSFVQQHAYVPHQQIVAEQQRAAVLLLLLNHTPNARGILTGKIFEYLASGRPVLAIGPEDGDVARLLEQSGSGIICGFTDRQKIRQALLQLWQRHGTNPAAAVTAAVQQYSRRNQARRVAELLDELTGQAPSAHTVR